MPWLGDEWFPNYGGEWELSSGYITADGRRVPREHVYAKGPFKTECHIVDSTADNPKMFFCTTHWLPIFNGIEGIEEHINHKGKFGNWKKDFERRKNAMKHQKKEVT